MQNLVNVNVNSEEVTISARELHKELGIGTRFNDWFNRMCDYGFVEGDDFYSILSKSNEWGRPSTDYNITIDMAKELCMLQRTEKGKECRRRLIQLEKDWNSPQKVMARALIMANNQLDMAKKELIEVKKVVREQQPKVEYHDEVLNKAGLIPISVIASDLGMSGMALNKLLVQHKIIFKLGGIYKPYSKYYWLIDEGYADYQSYERERVAPTLKWTEKGRKWIIEQYEKWLNEV